MRYLKTVIAGVGCTLTLNSIVQATPIEYTAGHADIRPVYENGELSLNFRFDTNAVLDGVPLTSPELHDTGNAYVRVSDSTLADPSDFSLLFSFFPDFFEDIGSPTQPFWTLPQNNVPGEPFFGFSTEELIGADWGSVFEFELTDFNGPGHFTLYQHGFGPTVQLSTADNVDSFAFPQGHDHFNWLFLEAGLYELEFTATGTHVADGVKSGTGTILFAVGDSTIVPEPGNLALLGLVAIGLFRRARRA